MNRVLHYFKNIKLRPLINRHIFEKGKQKYSGNNAMVRKNAMDRKNVRQFSTSNKQIPPQSPEEPLWIIVIVASSCELLNLIRRNKK
jgi:hypothetical protein